MSDQKGLHQKFEVRRTDGSSEPGGKHEDCRYFVLDLDHDSHARNALRAYAQSCCRSLPKLAMDLVGLLAEFDPRFSDAIIERIAKLAQRDIDSAYEELKQS